MSTQKVADDAGKNFSMFSMLSGKTTKLERAMAFGFAASSGYATIKKMHSGVRARMEYTITVKGEDSIYPEVHAWIIHNMPRDKQRAILVESTDNSSSGAGIIGDSETRAEVVGLRFLFDGNREQDVTINGHTIKVSVTDKTDEYTKRTKHAVKFTCPGIQARQAVMDLLSRISSERQAGQRVPRLYIASRWGDWSRRDDLTMRTLDSVILGAGIKETLLNDFEDFRSHEQDFIRMGVPYHRGYLFYGPPGSGKTSIAKALASHFGMDVYYMPLSDLETDSNLITMVSRVPAGSMLLLEDIDIAHVAKERNDNKADTATLSGMLNAIDGVATPHGLVVVMTTNNRSVLDDGLLRPGRVDLEMNIDYVTTDQVSRIFQTFAGVDASFGDFECVSSATVIGEILKHIDDPAAAIEAVRGLQ